MAYGNCRECGDEIPVAMWDDPVLSGAVVLVCPDCADEVPEDCLWDVSALEAAHEQWSGDDDHPNLVSEHPLADGEAWALQNRYANKDVYLRFLRASWTGTAPDDIEETVDAPDDEQWDLFVRNADDEEAIEAGRAALRDRLDQH